MRPILIPAILLLVSLFGCKETIIENSVPKEFTNDLLHADLVGKVVQLNSAAMVIVSQVAPVDSAIIDPADGSFAFRDLRIGNYDVTIKSDNYRIYQRSNVVLQGGSIVYLGAIDLSTVPDLVDQFSPEDNSEVVYDWRYGRIAISILFTHPMDRESVEKAFSTTPPTEGVFMWGNYTRAPLRTLYSDAVNGAYEDGATITTFSKVTSMTFSVSQKDSYADTLYTVTLATTAHDTLGNQLRFPLHFSFRTVQSYTTIYGIQTSPVHGDVDVSPLSYSSINLTFPRRMDHTSTETATTISPPLPLVFLWPSENVLRLYAGGPLPSDTTIKVQVAATARDKDGVALSQPFSFWFRTAPFQVTSTSPTNAQVFVGQTQQIYLYFNNYVTLSSVQQAFSISPQVSGSLSYYGTYPYDTPSEVVFSPTEEYKPNTKYTVTVSTLVSDMYGTPMRAPFTLTFITRPN